MMPSLPTRYSTVPAPEYLASRQIAFADSWIVARCSSVRKGAGASSTSFWWRRCSEQSRVPVLVGEHLRLDVPGPIEVALDEALAASERRHGLAHGTVVELGNLAHLAGDLQTASAAAERRLDRDRQAVLLGERDDLVGAADRIRRTGHERCAGP
jgi:hypothetical protein